MTWYLTVKTRGGDEHTIRIGTDENQAVRALHDAKGYIGVNGVVTVQDRLALDARDIAAVYLRDDSAAIPKFDR